MTHIDVRSALQSSLHHDYSDLVTRRTGQAVRSVIEQQLAGLADGSVVFLDFSRIGILDRSCADELLAKLVLGAPERPVREGYVVLHGVSDWHLETIHEVLDHHGLALVVEYEGVAALVGAVTDDERRCWQRVMELGLALSDHVATHTGIPCDACEAILESLARRRLLRRDGVQYLPLGSALA